jgi:hypothetical protein
MNEPLNSEVRLAENGVELSLRLSWKFVAALLTASDFTVLQITRDEMEQTVVSAANDCESAPETREIFQEFLKVIRQCR